MKREHWSSKAGFIFAAVGSAVGLANIWKFPFMVGQNGGAAFIVVYLIALFLIGFPVFVAEAIIGRTTQSNPAGAFYQLGKSKLWKGFGQMIVGTGFLVSSFYSAVAGWILCYLGFAVLGDLVHFTDASQTEALFNHLTSSPALTLSGHLIFATLCGMVLLLGVKGGIEKANKFLMPLLIFVLFTLVFQGLYLDSKFAGLKFLLKPDFSSLTSASIIAALGHAFFTLSLGQGTVITYGSYVSKKDNLPSSCLPIALLDTLISLLAAVAVFSIVFSVGIEADAGEGLLFQTLPLVFSKISGGYLASLFFFLLVIIAAISSEISAMEPLIAYLIDEWNWSRKKAVFTCTAGVMLIGVPCALSTNLLQPYQVFGMTFFSFLVFLCLTVMVPLGGFFAILLVGWKWGAERSFFHLFKGGTEFFRRNAWAKTYFWLCFKYITPVLMVLVFLNSLGII